VYPAAPAAPGAQPATQGQYLVVRRPPPHEHDGFFLRLALGFGFLRATEDSGLGSFALSGLSGNISIALGATITDNLNVAVEIFGGNVVEPTGELDGEEFRSAETTELTTSALGVGVTYYFMPINVYLAASLGAGYAVLETPLAIGDTDTGFALNLMAGKEWWVADDWGLGIAGQLFYMSLPDDGDQNLNVLSFALMFSATYN
jgi:hypothetical protein